MQPEIKLAQSLTGGDPYLIGMLFGVVLTVGILLVTKRYWGGDPKNTATKGDLMSIRADLDSLKDVVNEWVAKFGKGLSEHDKQNSVDFSEIKQTLTKLEAKLEAIAQRENDRDEQTNRALNEMKAEIRNLRDKIDSK